MEKILVLAGFAVLLSACGSAPPRATITPRSSSQEWSAPLKTPLSVEVGESLFVDGKIITSVVPGLRMSKAISSTMPGAYKVPFHFEIEQTDLTAQYRRGEDQFFCADQTKASASFPGLGVVVADGDCIGVMRNVRNGSLQWVVDNSYFNSQTTVWRRDVNPSDGVVFSEFDMLADDKVTAQRFVFDGAYGGLLHFTLRGGERSGSEFKFDWPPKNGDTTFGALGYVFEVLSVTNTTLQYQWVAIPAKAGS